MIYNDPLITFDPVYRWNDVLTEGIVGVITHGGISVTCKINFFTRTWYFNWVDEKSSENINVGCILMLRLIYVIYTLWCPTRISDFLSVWWTINCTIIGHKPRSTWPNRLHRKTPWRSKVRWGSSWFYPLQLCITRHFNQKTDVIC